ncbi:hypothetical protein ERO13_A01G109700v2 [Gossypium hirsutum]|uniref:BZIP transcription factor 27 n=4 Tax=Gossypium TaxID=3633 RepID=A0A1U8KHV2_GOSHI|nr:bZIP transcription factor 27-like [Gossypium hirsutum]KAB2096498.1 hypothetical protein ES319_A01G112000v1 [Gossypium barbadense]TYI42878.1 hypothetical protein ES332_A01G129000v1 [Gossypium tomentosum]TYJ49151.1 hypothetical protein E1A91_A01G114600v1 [Gossypium mustelinum]KAG4214253.1 hypothetical protein ERO13_A01G109700v2 [Gossypium hirsutum]TYI42879.1 hypothetical protein ES332_A01G129100v1 [Gossypium tomentosum]
MEEVWGDISLASLNDHPAVTPTANPPSFPSVILQDFLAIPINKEMPPTARSDCGTFLAEETTLFGSLPPTPATLFTLNARSIASVAVKAPTPSFPSSCRKKGQENEENSDDPRHKRKIKNRESAARSRARKQAYTNELELEVARLLEENAKLRRQQDKLLASPRQIPKRNTLCRTLTAPF